MSHSALAHAISGCRSSAKRFLPDSIRKPAGALCGRIFQRYVRPILGLLFDLFQGRYKTQGCEFEIPRDLTTHNFRACFFLDDYENEEREMIAKYIQPVDDVLEYGACIGVVSCTTNKLLDPGSKHVVIEGNPLLISSVAKNRVLNSCTFQIVNAAAAAEPGFMPFHIHPEYIVGGSTRDVGSVSFPVECYPLSTAIQRHGPFSALILDVEGAELELIKAGILDLRQFRVVVVEMHQFAYGVSGLEECRDILKASGLTFQEGTGDTEVWQRVDTIS